MAPHNYLYKSYDIIAYSSLTWQVMVTTMLHFSVVSPEMTSLVWNSLFRDCNSNISSCTISINTAYEAYELYLVQISIFQLRGLPSKYNTLWITINFTCFIVYGNVQFLCLYNWQSVIMRNFWILTYTCVYYSTNRKRNNPSKHTLGRLVEN